MTSPSTCTPGVTSCEFSGDRHHGSLKKIATLMLCLCSQVASAADFRDPNADLEALPEVPEGFVVSIFAREPLVRQPCSMAFDSAGRLFVGMGPQYRNPTPETPGDQIVMILDENGDGTADRTQVFAQGFNAIQGLAWHGHDLWVANSPDLTIVRDLDGDDVADEYVLVYTDLGNLEHGLHGLTWAPDGKLYMSKGNSKGLTQPGRIAPKPFRDLWGVIAPPGSPDFPDPKTFQKEDYRHCYHDPADDWGLDGGILRCDDGGGNLEIVARGFRNPWDIAYDGGFNWLGTDNDQNKGDRVFMPFFRAHFGWNHPWSSHWTDDEHLPTAPVSGPLFEGSGTGIVFGTSRQFPASYRGVFFINDWLRKTTFVWRPRWEGALMRPNGNWEPFIVGGQALFRPTDMEFGPDGALWILGWGSGYGAAHQDGELISEGRIFRVQWKEGVSQQDDAPLRQPLAEWSVAQLLREFDSPLPVRRIDTQDELVRRGPSIWNEMTDHLRSRDISQMNETWTSWTLGRISQQSAEGREYFEQSLQGDSRASENLKLQSIRILSSLAGVHQNSPELSRVVPAQLKHSNPRFRLAAVTALAENPQTQCRSELLDLLAEETDTVTYYSAWQALRTTVRSEELCQCLNDPCGGVRRGALLALLETHALGQSDVAPLTQDPDQRVRDIAMMWIEATSHGIAAPKIKGPALSGNDASPAIPLARHLRSRQQVQPKVIAGGLKAGAKIYLDQKERLKQMPDVLKGADYIQAASAPGGSQGAGMLSFDLLLPVRVNVAWDTRSKHIPAWLEQQFEDRQLQLETDQRTYQLFSREFPGGRVELGDEAGREVSDAEASYFVILELLPLQQQPVRTSLQSSLELLSQADEDRGELLFTHPQGAGCSKCHSLNTIQTGFGPNLSDIGQRAAARHIMESITDPSAVITEGFNILQVHTEDGRTYAGVLVAESGLTLTLGLASGECVDIPQKSIELQQSGKISAMPSMSDVLSSQQVADLVAFLLTKKTSAPGTVRSSVETPPSSEKEAQSESKDRSERSVFVVSQLVDRLVIKQGPQTIAEYVHNDPRILRPYFANLSLSDGTKVTRNHPPVEGADAREHAEMHPGIWMAFGEISGHDFWRNKGKIRQTRWVETPEVTGADLRFADEWQFLSQAGQPVCRAENRFLISQRPCGWRLIWDARIFADHTDIIFGDQQEMGLGCRVATSLLEKNGGELLNSSGLMSAEGMWGQPADWCDSSAMFNGQRSGLTVLASPANVLPSYWHTRNYGLMVANPFGRKALKQGKLNQVIVKSQESLRLCFACVIHQGNDYDPAEELKNFSTSTATITGNK